MPAPIAQGIRDFVSALGARGQIRQAAEANAWKSADDRLKAELLADELMSKRGLGDAYTNLGIERGGDLATVSRAGYANFPQATQGLKDLADLALQRQAVDIANAPNADVAMLNRILSARTQGGGPLSPQEASVVPLGEALVNRERTQSQADLARAGASEAQALANQALAALRGRTDPNLRSVGNKSRLLSGGAPTAPSTNAPSWRIPTASSVVTAPPRAGTAEEDLRAIEQDLGTLLTQGQRDEFLRTGQLAIPQRADFSDVMGRRASTEAIDGQLPEVAKRQLKEGVETTFQNQQVWTLRDGNAIRLR